MDTDKEYDFLQRQVLCTVDEETGLTGAFNLDPVALDLQGRASGYRAR